MIGRGALFIDGVRKSCPFAKFDRPCEIKCALFRIVKWKSGGEKISIDICRKYFTVPIEDFTAEEMEEQEGGGAFKIQGWPMTKK